MAKTDDLNEAGERPPGGLSAGLVIGGVLGAALALFVVQNTGRTRVEWLVFETTQPLWAVLLITAAVTLVVVELIGGARRRRKRKR